MTDKDKAAAAAADVLPTIDDDIEIAPSPPSETAQEDAEPSEDGKAPRPPVVDEAHEGRERAVQRYRELRTAQEQAFAEGREAADAKHAQNAAPDQEGGEQTISLTVDGKRVAKPLSEVVAAAQKYQASDNRLEEAKRLVNEAKAIREQAAAHQQPNQYRYEPKHHDPDSARREKLRRLAEQIQVGDAEEGADALNELFSDSQEIERRVDARLAQTRTQTEIRGALERFETTYPDVARNPLLADAGMTALRIEIARDIESVAGVTKEALDPLRGNVQALVEAQRRLRASGHKLRSPDELLAATGKVLTKTFNIKSVDSGTVQQRLTAKRTATQQPRTAGVRGQVQQPPRPRTTQEIVQEQRKVRGFPANR